MEVTMPMDIFWDILFKSKCKTVMNLNSSQNTIERLKSDLYSQST